MNGLKKKMKDNIYMGPKRCVIWAVLFAALIWIDYGQMGGPGNVQWARICYAVMVACLVYYVFYWLYLASLASKVQKTGGLSEAQERSFDKVANISLVVLLVLAVTFAGQLVYNVMNT
ncbi:MAG: hypothetical protein LKJ83_01930 [Eubacteriaceae bacterium]|jgi:Ca2+/Na+ antiporter|nr:hypothetical protein [Eubacteriaceae bacterium]